MDLQQQQLNQLSDWLTRMEAGIKSHPPVGSSEEQVKQQLQIHQVCTQLAFCPRLTIFYFLFIFLVCFFHVSVAFEMCRK